MRMWMVNPKIMCRKHLMGSHVEIHMFLGSVRKGISMNGYINNDLLEPLSLKNYHDRIVKEMIFRGYKHKTELSDDEFYFFINKIKDNFLFHKININNSKNELLNRCNLCSERFQNFERM